MFTNFRCMIALHAFELIILLKVLHAENLVQNKSTWDTDKIIANLEKDDFRDACKVDGRKFDFVHRAI